MIWRKSREACAGKEKNRQSLIRAFRENRLEFDEKEEY